MEYVLVLLMAANDQHVDHLSTNAQVIDHYPTMKTCQQVIIKKKLDTSKFLCLKRDFN